MKKKKTDPKEGTLWPPTYAKDVVENTNKSHHELAEEAEGPGGDAHHAQEEARVKENNRVWKEKNKRNLPPKKHKKSNPKL